YLSREHPLYETHLCRLRSLRMIPVLLGPSIPRRDRGDEERELWSRAMLILFKPWRRLSDLKSGQQTWRDAYDAHEFPPHLQRIINNMHVEAECRDARSSHDAARR
ncbi:hypothetical protein FA95DRAFT_1464697, partial [Auriscalpium vulgare]